MEDRKSLSIQLDLTNRISWRYKVMKSVGDFTMIHWNLEKLLRKYYMDWDEIRITTVQILSVQWIINDWVIFTCSDLQHFKVRPRVQFRKNTPDAKKLVVHMKVDEYQCKVFLQGNDYTLEAMLLMVYYNSKIIPVKQIMKNEIRKNIYPRTN